MTIKLILVLGALCAMCGSAIAGGLQNVVDVRVLPGWRQADGTHVAALEMRLQDGWKTYWRAPGETGIPPRFDWHYSRNVNDVRVIWPTPKQLVQGGLVAIGYDRSVVLPLSVRPLRSGRPVSLSGEIEIGVCKDVCVPVTLMVDGDLRPDSTRRDTRIVAALAARPYTAEEAGVRRVSCEVSPAQGGIAVRARIDLPHAGGREAVVIETGDPKIWVARAKTSRHNGYLVAETVLQHVDGRAFAVDRSALRITVLGRSHAVDIQGCPAR